MFQLKADSFLVRFVMKHAAAIASIESTATKFGWNSGTTAGGCDCKKKLTVVFDPSVTVTLTLGAQYTGL
ncbi:MAG TPA: hypothetical protein VED86_06190 [archaeon]|nr:hypothetical protein [archaeon]